MGRPGTGKSQFATRLALEYASKPGCYIVAHDVNWRLPAKLHDGKVTGIRRHKSVAEVTAALASRDPRGIHCVPSSDAGPVIEIARATSAASLEKHADETGYPAIVLIDEIVAAGMCKPAYLADPMVQLITQRRHYNVGLIWTCQSARMVHNQLISLATTLFIFKLTDKKDFDRLEEAGISPEVCEQVRKLPNYKHVRVDLQ